MRKCASNYDIVILHGFTPLIAFGIIASGSKIVFINHGIIGTGRKLGYLEYIKKFLLYFFSNIFVNIVVNVSSFSMFKFVSEFGVNPDRCRVIYNTTDFPREKLNLKKSENIILGYHGRFVQFKRLDRLILISHCINKYRKSTVRIVGSGPLREYYMKLSASLGVDLIISDFTNDVLEEIAKFDFEIIPSNEENFGISVLESIFSGKITFVFSDGGGCTEIFGNRFNWYVCKNVDEVAEKILYLCNSFSYEDERRFYSLQEYVMKHFSKEVMQSEYSKLFKNLADGKK